MRLPLEARLDCGWDDDGRPRVIEGPVTRRVRLRSRVRPVRQRGSGSLTVQGTRMELEGQGILQEDVPCRLRHEFAESLLLEVARPAGA